MQTPTDPGEVWKMIARADDLLKYAPNRDPEVARRQARTMLERAAEAAAALEDRGAGEALSQQVRTRLADLTAAGGSD